MGLVNITGGLDLPDGSDAGNRKIIIRKAHRMAESDSGRVVLNDDVMVTSSAAGLVDFDLYDGQYVALYGWDYGVDKYFSIIVPDVSGPLVLANLIPEPIQSGARNVYYTKRGDTIRFGCIYLDQWGVVSSLQGISVSAAMEHEQTDMRKSFVSSIVSAPQGRFDLILSASSASDLDIGWYNFDVRFSDGLSVKHTHTGRIHVSEEIA